MHQVCLIWRRYQLPWILEASAAVDSGAVMTAMDYLIRWQQRPCRNVVQFRFAGCISDCRFDIGIGCGCDVFEGDLREDGFGCCGYCRGMRLWLPQYRRGSYLSRHVGRSYHNAVVDWCGM